MKLEKFDTKKKKKNFVIAGIAVVLIALVGIVVYKSYALYQVEKSYNVLKGQVGDFSSGGDIQLAWTLDGSTSSGSFPTAADKYEVNSVTCEDGATASWDSTNWGLINIDSNGNSSISCIVDFSKVYLCKRATTLHTDTCTQASGTGCRFGSVYSSNETISYGKLNTGKSYLSTGDALDCDINGNGTYDAATERFYFVDYYYVQSNNDTHPGYAALIYYNNVSGGWPSVDAKFAWNSSYEVYNPSTAIAQLPTTSQWVTSLYTSSRYVKDYNSNVITSGVNYSGRAARLLTEEEISIAGCNDNDEDPSLQELNNDKGCNFLYENTNYAAPYSSVGTRAYWLENANGSGDAAVVWGDNLVIEYTSQDSTYGVRPVIDVSLDDIKLN